ncbi:S-layer protein [Methanocaldococcus bathoardescens]|uniref:S-layer protein n=1 Tax=Methanocaldococcus bathoardescens TaxID=1301915 RepID=A0A076LBY2_9EURY|nr:S-layer protein [Methanocaldococcus bathoardescens]AIJ05925.1 S-layer protein [Methanocaldococcus bathoardescens]
MAMSLKKIGAIAVGGAMVATALASGVAAEVTVIGDVSKDLFVKDGQPNCYVVVGADAPSTMDVVSAADIAAKIGSLCYKEGTVEDGSADIKIHAVANSDDWDILKNEIPNGNYTVFVAASDSDYSDSFDNAGADNYGLDANALDLNTNNVSKTVSLGDVATMLKVEDIDPSDWYNSDGDAGEIVAVAVKNDSDSLTIDKKAAIYMTLAYTDGGETFADHVALKPGMRIPFLGQEQAVVKIDADDDVIYLGTSVYDGVLKEGETYDVGNGYEVKVKSVLKSTNQGEYKVTIDILKDGKVVAEKSDTVTSTQSMKVIYGDKVGVVVHGAWMDVGENYGYAELLICKDVKELELGKKYVGDWKVYAITNDTNDKIELKSSIDSDTPVFGIALRYDGDKLDDLDSGDELDILDYVTFKFDDKDKTDKLYVYFSMDKSVDATLDIGQKVSALNADVTLKGIKADAVTPVALTAPIAKLDTEVSLDTADKNLVLVGGPVANKLTKALVDAGKLTLDNDSPATIAVLPGEANGHDVVVVAGGDREKTREAALELIKMI